MNAFTNLPTEMPVRENLTSAYRDLWDWIAGPGNWWTGAERVAIAAEARGARDCEFCAVRKEALSPSMTEGTHTTVQDILSEHMVDAVHRIATDATRITQSWIEETFSGDLTDAHYVELLGITVLVISVDQFYRALSIPLEPLPEPREGEPSRYRPSTAESGVGYIPMIPADLLVGDEADLAAGPNTPNVVRAMSLVPDCVRQMQNVSAAQYLPVKQIATLNMDVGRALDRAQIELVAARVSSINECFY